MDRCRIAAQAERERERAHGVLPEIEKSKNQTEILAEKTFSVIDADADAIRSTCLQAFSETREKKASLVLCLKPSI